MQVNRKCNNEVIICQWPDYRWQNKLSSLGQQYVIIYLYWMFNINVKFVWYDQNSEKLKTREIIENTTTKKIWLIKQQRYDTYQGKLTSL